jgi:hypothetical protein
MRVPEYQTRGVNCPYCKAGIDKIDVGMTTTTLNRLAISFLML